MTIFERLEDDDVDQAALRAARRPFLPAPLEIVVDFDDVAPARARVSTWLHRYVPGLGRSRHADILIAASELLSNASEHATADGATLHLGALPAGTVALAVTNAAGRGAVPQPGEWALPADPLALSGRGLGIIDRVADCGTVDYSNGMVTVTAIFDVRTPPPHR